MWVFSGGMVRSGSTLQYQLAAHLIEKAKRGARLGWYDPEELAEVLRTRGEGERLLLLKSHICTDAIREEFRKGNAKGIYVYRDLRAVTLSAMGKFSKSFDELLDGGFLDGCVQEHVLWTSHKGVLASKYEEMVNDLPREVKRIADHLDIQIDEPECRRIAEMYSPDAQRKRVDSIAPGVKARTEIKSGVPYDPVSLLHPDHFGRIPGDTWESVFSPAQVSRIEEQAGPWLVAHGYPLSSDAMSKKNQTSPQTMIETRSDVYYGQYGEDYLLARFFDGKESGFFVDVGAFDGIFLSNSFYFERKGWKGICVEPHPTFHPLCRRNRPRSTCLEIACASPGENPKAQFFAEPSGLFSALGQQSAGNIRRRYEEAWGIALKDVTTVQVETLTLNSVLERHLLPGASIDFVSIDVEGSELDVLSGFDLDRYKPRVLVVEANSESAEEALTDYLAGRGYLKARKLYVNCFFVRNEEDVRRIRSIVMNYTCARVRHPIVSAYTPFAQEAGEIRDEREMILQQWSSEVLEEKRVGRVDQTELQELRRQLVEKEEQIRVLAGAAEERLKQLQEKEEVIRQLAAGRESKQT